MSADELFEKLAKLERLFRDTESAGERAAAGAAIDRLKERLGGGAPPESEKPKANTEELKLSLPDTWTMKLFVAICRKHRVTPYRYKRQRRTTIMVEVEPNWFDHVVLREFSKLQAEVQVYFQDTVDHLIASAMSSNQGVDER